MNRIYGVRRPARGRNPVGVGFHGLAVPRVARSSQPWALRRNPFGILPMVGSWRAFFRVGESIGGMNSRRLRFADSDFGIRASFGFRNSGFGLPIIPERIKI